MRVCIDIQAAISQVAGVGRYTRMLTQHLGELAGPDSISLFFFDFHRRGMGFSVPGAKVTTTRCPGKLVNAAWKTVKWPPFEFFAGAADLYHFPNFVIPPLGRRKAVVTIHDMSFVRFPQFAEEKNLRHLTANIRTTSEKADAIITDSQFSADEICALLNVPSSRVFPIHLGISERFAAPQPADTARTLNSLGISKPYILTVGTVEPRKNIGFLVEVFENLRSFDGQLVIAGMPGWKCEPILQRIRSSSAAARIKQIGCVNDADLPALYAGAELFVTTSFYEGFGFPPLEAMACGTPVVSSTGGSLREVLGDGAELVDGFEIDKWRNRMEAAISDSNLRSRLVTAGNKRAAVFSWRKTARETWSVYRSL